MGRFMIDMSEQVRAGLLGGIGAAQHQQALDMQRQRLGMDTESHALNMEAARQELADRKLAAQNFLDSKAADEEFFRWVDSHQNQPMGAGAAPTGPRPQQVGADPITNLQVLGQGNQPAIAPPAGIAAPAPAIAAPGAPGVPAGPGAGSIYAGLDPRVLARMSPSKQNAVTEGLMNRLALQQRRRDSAQQYAEMKAAGMHRYAPAKVWEQWALDGVPVDINDAPEDFRNMAVNESEAEKNAKIDIMTIGDPSQPGHPVDDAARARLLGMPPAAVDVIYRDWQAQRLMQHQLDLQTRKDPLADDRMRWTASAASEDVKTARDEVTAAEKEYRALTAYKTSGGVQHEGLLQPPKEPTAQQRRKANTPMEGNWGINPFSGPTDSSIKDAKAAVATWDAWQRYLAAKAKLQQSQANHAQVLSHLAAAPAAPAAPVAPPAPISGPATGAPAPSAQAPQENPDRQMRILEAFRQRFPGENPDPNNPNHVAAMQAIAAQTR